MRLSRALLALCIVPLCASGANAQAPSPWPTSPQQAPAAPQQWRRPRLYKAGSPLLNRAGSPLRNSSSSRGSSRCRPACRNSSSCATTPKRKRPRSRRRTNGRRHRRKRVCSSPRSRIRKPKCSSSSTKMANGAEFRRTSAIRSSRAPIKVAEIRTKVCQVAAAPQRQQGPSLSDALSAPVPDSNNIKTGRGTYDTLTGSPLGNK